jgi:hypothetical protein
VNLARSCLANEGRVGVTAGRMDARGKGDRVGRTKGERTYIDQKEISIRSSTQSIVAFSIMKTPRDRLSHCYHSSTT